MHDRTRTARRRAADFARSLLAAFVLALAPALLRAQHEHHAPPDSTRRGDRHGAHAAPRPLGVPYERMGSGTSWLPDAAPMHALHATPGPWTVMMHGVAYGVWNDQRGPRGDTQLGLVDWEMLMAMRPLAGGTLHLHAMTSLEPLVLGGSGYPLLLQTGESWRGEPLHDRQHPHDLVMEIGAMYERAIADGVAATLYVAPVGEPALGPVAFMHRASADGDPLAPLGHHWQDATHITYGVVTAGLGTRRMKLEGSLFNGREPDENRTDFDYDGAPLLDSWAARLSLAPTARWSLALSYGRLASPEPAHPGEAVRRLGAIAQYARPLGAGHAAATLVVGANRHAEESRWEPSYLLEGSASADGRLTLFARAEWLKKTAGDLVLEDAPEEMEYAIGSLAAGVVRELAGISGFTLGAGARGSVARIPEGLEAAYGTRTPTGVALYLRLRPRTASMAGGAR